MLAEFVNNLSFESSLLIKDSVDKSAACLIEALIQQALNQGRQVIRVNTEPTFAHHPTIRHEVTNIDVFDRYDTMQEKLSDAITSDSYVIFPSLSLLLFSYPFSQFAQMLRLLKEDVKVSGIVALIHTDVLLKEEVLPMTEYLFNSKIHVLAPEHELAATYYAQVKCLRRKANGKLETSDEYFSIDDSYSFTQVHASSSAIIKSYTEAESSDIVSNLTFNLSLSNKEREAKNKLQLPYLKKDSEKAVLLSKNSSIMGHPAVSIGDERLASSAGGKIYYHYDDADDFDEEDPDDDLDI